MTRISPTRRRLREKRKARPRGKHRLQRRTPLTRSTLSGKEYIKQKLEEGLKKARRRKRNEQTQTPAI